MASQMFLKLGSNIKGETTDDAHKDWCEILSFSHGVTQPSSPASSTGGRTGAKASFSDFSVMKYVDMASPDIMHHCAAGKLIPEVKIHVCVATGDENKAHVLMEYTLGNCVISSCSPSGSDGGGKPTESVTLAYGTITMAYTPTDDSQAAGSEAKRGWDCQTNKTL